MAARGWGGSLATAVGVAAGAGAAQLGLGYGLGIISWQPNTDGQTATWVASLAWTAWIAATSAVAGAYCADRLSPTAASTLEKSPGRLGTALWRIALAISSGVGASITVALVAVPARAAVRFNDSSPQTTAGAYAVLGVILGLLIAIGALASRAIAANVIASVSWLWLLAIVAVIDGVAAGRGIKAAQLGVWQFTLSGPLTRNVHVWDALLTLAAALVIGALAALPAARRGDNGVGIAISGAMGPLLVAAAYFLAAPKLSGVGADEMSPYLVAPYAVIAGLAGSVAVAGLAPRIQKLRLAGARPRPTKPIPAQPGESLPAGASASAARVDADSSDRAGGFGAAKSSLWPDDPKSGTNPTGSPARTGTATASTPSTATLTPKGKRGRGRG